MNNPVNPRIQKTYLVNQQHLPDNRQRGVVLVISLIMLMLMTLIGTTSMQSTTLEEKMAGNMRDRNLAFQAAESALEAGELFLASKTIGGIDDINALNFNCQNGLYNTIQGAASCAAQNFWDAPKWTGINSVKYVGKLAHIQDDANPVYVIEIMDTFDCQGSGAGSNDCRRFRVTARATGGTAEAVVMLQSIYQRHIK